MGKLIARTVALAALGGASVASLAVAGGSTAATVSPGARLVASALHDASVRGSMHEVGVAVEGKSTVTLTDDLSLAGGRQDIVHFGNEHAHVLIVGTTAYFSGNQAALTGYFGLSAQSARKVGTRWVSVPKSNRDYAQLAAGATLISALGQLSPPGKLTETAPTTIDGQSVVGIRGTPANQAGATASSILYVTRSKDPLPVRLSVSVTSSSGNVRSTVDLSGWGEHVVLTAPTGAIPVAST